MLKKGTVAHGTAQHSIYIISQIRIQGSCLAKVQRATRSWEAGENVVPDRALELVPGAAGAGVVWCSGSPLLPYP